MVSGNKTENAGILNNTEQPVTFFESAANIGTTFFSISPDGKEIYFLSGGYEKISGYSKNEILTNPKALFRLLEREFIPGLRAYLKAINAGKTGSFEYRIKNHKGEYLYLRHTGIPVIKDGKVERVDVIVQDITTERQKVQELRKSEERLRILFETAEDLIFVLDSAGNFVTVNSNGAIGLEYLPNELTGRHILDFVKEDEQAVVQKSFSEMLKTSKLVTFEATFISKFSKEVILEVNAKSLYESGVKFDGVVGIGRDVTNRKRDREKVNDLNNKLIEANRIISIEKERVKQRISVLEELNRLKSEFVSNISHELRTPLASIIGFSETIESDPDMPPEMRNEFNSIILTEAKRLAALINDVLDISKLEGGNMALNKTAFDLPELVDEILQKIKSVSRKKNLIFAAEYSPAKITIYADKERISQVISNVLNNSVKFTNDGGRISVYTRILHKEVEIIISDTGIGIPKKDLGFVFQKFYRVNRPDITIPGSGLGLSLVKQIVDLHKGFVSIRSEENQGTSVIIQLPLSQR